MRTGDSADDCMPTRDYAGNAHPGVWLVHCQRVHVEVVVDDDIEAVGRQEAHKVEESRVHVCVWQQVVAPADALRVARGLHEETPTISHQYYR